MEKWMLPLLFVLLGLSASAQVYTEVSNAVGIDHHHTHQYIMGGGIAILDFDQDGWPDVFMTGGETQDKLYRNLGDGTFADVTTSAQIPLMNANGVAAGDLNNDGFPDLVIATYPGESDRVLRNNQDGTFTEMVNALGVTNDWGSSITLGDVNKDGLLDIYVACYVETSAFLTDSAGTVIGFAHEGYSNRFYLNQGSWQFLEDAAWYNLADEGCALATTFTDFDNDLDMDIFLANDFGEWVMPNRLFENQYPWTYFNEVSYDLNVSTGIYGMGVAIGDYDHDNDLDYYITNMGDNLLHRNDSTFSYQTEFAGVENDSIGDFMTTSWGTMFMDYDNDMWQDLFVANGNVTTGLLLQNIDDDPDKMFRNNGDGTFSDETISTGFGEITRSRGAVYTDFDKDGDLDVFISTVDIDSLATVRNLVYRNDQNNGNHYLQIKPIGILSNRDAIGTHARIVVEGESWIMELDGGSSYASSNQKILHFGLGTNTFVDSLIITFPSGIEQVLVGIAADQYLEVVEDYTVGASVASTSNIPSVIYENGMPYIQNASGPIEIFDASGRSVKRLSPNPDQVRVKLGQGLPPGVFMVSVGTRPGSTLRFVVM